MALTDEDVAKAEEVDEVEDRRSRRRRSSRRRRRGYSCSSSSSGSSSSGLGLDDELLALLLSGGLGAGLGAIGGLGR